VVKYLAGRGARIETPEKYGNTPFTSASSFGHQLVVSYLLDRGATPDVSDTKAADWALVLNLVCLGKGEVVDVLVRRWGRTNELAGKTQMEQICWLLGKGLGTVEGRIANGRTALHAASKAGNVELCRFLLDSGAQVNARCKHSLTPLNHAAWGGHFEVADVC
jgi:uncharacterized protein